MQLREFVSADGPRRYKQLRVSQDLFVDWFTTGFRVAFEIESGIPKGAKVVNILAAFPDLIVLVLEHESFDEVPFGELIPELTITGKPL